MNFDSFITITQATKLIPGRPSFSTVWRWCTYGIKTPSGERVRLRYALIGRTKVTTNDWLTEFFTSCAKAELERFNGKRTFGRAREKRRARKTTNRDISQRRAYDILRQRGIDIQKEV